QAALELNGVAPLASYQALLRQVEFHSTSDNPTDYGASPARTLVWTVDDGKAPATATTTINIVARDDPPFVRVQPAAAYTENSTPVTLSPAAIVTDSDSFDLAAGEVRITDGLQAGDLLLVNGAASGTFAGIAFFYDAGTGSLFFHFAQPVPDYQ